MIKKELNKESDSKICPFSQAYDEYLCEEIREPKDIQICDKCWYQNNRQDFYQPSFTPICQRCRKLRVHGYPICSSCIMELWLIELFKKDKKKRKILLKRNK